MNCKICCCSEFTVVYDDVIRNGSVGNYTNDKVKLFQCKNCGAIFHLPYVSNDEYYRSEEYRTSVDGSSDADTFQKNHDKESLDKLEYTGTEIFRNKVVADIGCGGGSFLDYVRGVAKEIIAIEPSENFLHYLHNKGIVAFPYAKDAVIDFKEKVDIVTSFDVIEHVEDPVTFLRDSYTLLNEKGTAIIGTPTDAPFMRSLLGNVYEKKVLFSVQHLWYLSEESIKIAAKKAGFKKYEVKYFQRYGISNMMAWLRDKKPEGNIHFNGVSDTLNAVYKEELERQKLGDYIVLYASK